MNVLFEKLGLIAAVILPLWNIPLVYRMIQRKSSKDISLSWTLGVWICFLFMAPSGFASEDIVYRTFSVMNLIFFTMVVVTVLRYHKGAVRD